MSFPSKPTVKEKKFIEQGSDRSLSYHMFQLRIPTDLLALIDEKRKEYPSIASRTQVIIDILEESLKNK